MSRILVWDLPTRLFHWFFTATVLGALAIAVGIDDESGFFQIHMLLGLVAGFLVLLRLIWGIVGSRYARFGSFLFGPRALVDYLLGASRRTGERYIGHNPGSAWAIYAMLLLSLGLAASGLLMASWEEIEELHEILAFAMVAVVGAHLAGIILHTIRHRETIALGMLHGRKEGQAAQGISSSLPLVGIVFLALTIGCTAILLRGYDAQAGQISLFGKTIRLGESEQEGDGHHEESRYRRRHRDGEQDRRERRDRNEHHDEDDD